MSTASNEQVSRRGFVTGAVAAGAAVGAAGLMGANSAHAEEAPSGSLNMDDLNAWLKDRVNYSAAAGGTAYIPGEEPTDEELVEMLHIANSFMWCHFLTAPHFIVVRDPEEQAEMLGTWGVTGEGTVTVLVLADGCKNQEHHEVPYNTRTDDVHYWRMYYALVEVGQAQAYLNMAARSMGFRIRNFAALNIPNISYEEGMGDQEAIPLWACGGDWDIVQDANWDISKYCHSKDGSVDFTHYVLANDEDIDIEENLTLVFAITIGKVDETDTDSSATTDITRAVGIEEPLSLARVQQNFCFWDTGAVGTDL